MKYRRGKTIAMQIGAALCLLAASADEAFAQRDRSGPPSPVERRIEQLNRQSEEYERDKLNADLKGPADKPSDQRPAQSTVAQIEQDFKGLQAGYNQIVLAMAAKGGLNYDLVLAAVAEIKKCSTRLKGNLVLPRPNDNQEKKVRGEAGSDQLEESLMSLRKYIYSFVTNPLFESGTVLDVAQAGKASRDLDEIIELSKSIRKSGDRLKKAQ